ncbi:MAG TPA: methylated-DNA--[protein]-cysteine S-methyltransferase [Acidimicrobiia bacterium]|nr:methylated-DNA--[protein]-cysteine S-methyltransferase [Acidimicrobiia bacterium]
MNDLETALGNLGDLGIPAASAARRFVDEAGEMVDIAYTTIDSPLGELIIAATPRGLLRIGFENETGVLDDLAERVSPRILEYPARLERIRHELGEYFTGRRDRFEVPLDWGLIDGFRRRVLTVTAQIPYGGVATYQDVARRAGQPRGARAAGQALGGNPIPVIIPCHRVVRSGGGMGGYGGGTDRKEFLLRLEGAML